MYLGIDLGTSEVKAALIGADGSVVGYRSAKVPISKPQPLWSEQSPADWISATVDACRLLREAHPDEYQLVAGIGLAGHMHGATLLDQAGDVLRPCLLWNDGRSAAQCQALMQQHPEMVSISGNLVMPGFTAPKLQWVREHESQVFSQVAKVLLPKDYLRYVLTGSFYSDLSDSAGTLWLDTAKRRWSTELLAATGLSVQHMPELIEGTDQAGALNQRGATLLHLTAGIPFAGGAGDNAASAIGLGAISAGDGFLSLGTSGVIFLTTEQFAPNPASAVHAFCHAVPQTWHQMSVMLSAACCLTWAAKQFRYESEAQLIQAASQLTKDERALSPLFLPYLTGERTPHNDANASGVLFGMRDSTSTAQLAYAVIEGVSFGLLDGLNALRQVGGQLDRLLLVGGGSRSEWWAQLLANVLNLKIDRTATSPIGAALGAARLAQIAAEKADTDRIRQICAKPSEVTTLSPDRSDQDALSDRFARFKSLYRALKTNT
jgi:xylulokinase